MQAGNTLFKVDKNLITNASEVFAEMLQFPPGNFPVEGQSDRSPIILPCISAEAFACLITFLKGWM